MPIQRSCQIENLEEREYRIFWDNSLTTTIKEILSEPNPFYAESSVQVVERLIINCVVNNFLLIDIDYNWPRPHYYIGNYQLAGWETSYSGVAENEGFINATTTIIEKYSAITIAADPNQLGTIAGNIKIEQCNFQLIPELKLIPPAITPVVSYQAAKGEPLFEGFLQQLPPVLQAQTFQPKISEALVKTRPGCELFSALYSIAPVNNVFVAEPAYVLPVCKLPEDTACDTQFSNFILSNNSGQPINTPGGSYFTSNEACQASNGGGLCTQRVFTCSDGDTRGYWEDTPI